MAMIPVTNDLSRLSSNRFAELLSREIPVVVLLPVGSVEPHGPHLTLITDTTISIAAAVRSIDHLSETTMPIIAPAVPYGVTECAAAFKGAVSVPAKALTSLLRGIVTSFLADGVAHVCIINNHLEPEHHVAVCDSIEGLDTGAASVACPLTRRWGRLLSDEFKSGACHAGEYETSIILAADNSHVDMDEAKKLPENRVSLAEKLQAGVTDFVEMGLTNAYAGSPSSANARHGDQQLEFLATMVATEVLDALASAHD